MTSCSTSRRLFLGGGAAVACALGLPTRVLAQTEPYALGEFHRPDAALSVALSPDGRRLAVLQQTPQGDRQRAILDIVSADDPGGARVRVPIGDVQAQRLEWADDRHVLLVVITETEVQGNRPMHSMIREQGRTITARRVLSIDADTGRGLALFGEDRQALNYNLDLGRIIDTVSDRPGHILMAARGFNLLNELYRVSLSTGRSELVERGVARTLDWKTVDGVPVLRRDLSARGDVQTWRARPIGGSEWRFVRSDRILEQPQFTWAGPSETAGAVRVLARAEGEDVIALRDMDLTTLQLGPPIRTREGFDADHEVLDAARRPIATGFVVDRLDYDFPDPAVAPHYRAMNRFFNDEASVRIVGADTARNRILTYVEGPREPGAWYLYNRQARDYTNIAARRTLEAQRLAPMTRLRVATRDGSEIGAYLTRPSSGAKGPLIALVHGGPQVRDAWSYDRQAQALASQGFWVVQPNFRGSGGFGETFADQGDRQWGGRVQEDIEDAVLAAVSEGGLDASRVGIMGASFGGYSALMSPILRPDLYKAAVSICGFSDLPDLLAEQRRDDDSPGQQIYAREVVRLGDPRADAAEQVRWSPRRRAGEMPCPVLMTHGVDDAIVPVGHSRRMRDALQGAGRPVELIEIADAGHGDWDLAEEGRLMARYVAFFRRHLG
ncbi:alpha/beta hydrolase family protein [Brevundimonas lutea]|uniref:alpha/beta hydrolase family protein n=1 Tax=Brevundimonas lutea TaxID=2293980 RepID=UPI000F02A119|nr:alpha/beta fold hydrolase [Brevundimonas lutea]